jgi:hypothetical protein
MEKNKDYYEKLDKRTKEYKKWKASFDSDNGVGLGDVVEKITEATGIKKAVKSIFGDDCGCDERKEALNKIRFFSQRNVECLTEEEYFTLEHWFSEERNVVTTQDQILLFTIYNRVYNMSQKRTSCSSCIKTVIHELKLLFNEYHNN